jgi:photoactive yellow protein
LPNREGAWQRRHEFCAERGHSADKILRKENMGGQSVQFDANNLVEQIEQLSQHELDYLPFGVILLDREGTVLFYSETEAQKSGYGKIPRGLNLFDISPCMAAKDFRGRIQDAMDKGPVNLEFGWAGDYADPTRDLRLRVMSSINDGIWIFIERDNVGDVPQPCAG